jgi:hypothetical protein
LLATGAEVTAIGTGGKRYALAFIEEERVPFPVLLDSDGEAAEVVGTKTLGLASVVRPKAAIAAGRSLVGGHRQGTPGKRPLQLGATLVIGPGDELLYSDFEDFAGDHAPLDEVLSALRG